MVEDMPVEVEKPKEVVAQVEIRRTSEKTEAARFWRAVIRIPKDIISAGAGICGGGTEQGPWCEGFGYSPEGAVKAAYEQIGRAVVLAHMAKPAP